MTSAQLVDAGMTPKAIAHRVATGWLVRLHRGVFLVGPLEAPLSRARAAVLAVGEGALLSHLAAAALWEFVAPRPGAIDVTVPGRNARNRAGIRDPPRHPISIPTDITRRRDLPVTSPARTLLDLATRLTPRDLARATEEAQVQRRVTPHSLNEQFTALPQPQRNSGTEESDPDRPSPHEVGGGATPARTDPRGAPPEPRTNVKVGRPRGRFPLAGPND